MNTLFWVSVVLALLTPVCNYLKPEIDPPLNLPLPACWYPALAGGTLFVLWIVISYLT